MNSEIRAQILENAYVGVMVDALYNFQKHGVLEKVTEDKKKLQMLMGKKQAEQFKITKSEDVFRVLGEVFNCANWEIQECKDGFIATAKACKLCAFSKKLGNVCPCDIYCLNPMDGMIRGIEENSKFEALETLWDGSQCRVKVTRL